MSRTDYTSGIKLETSAAEVSLDQYIAQINRLVTIMIQSEDNIQVEESTDPYILADKEAKLEIQTDEAFIHGKHQSKRAEPWLYERLGAAITKRRQYLEWRRAQRTNEKPVTGIDLANQHDVVDYENSDTKHHSAETSRRISDLFAFPGHGTLFWCPSCQTQQAFESEQAWRYGSYNPRTGQRVDKLSQKSLLRGSPPLCLHV